MSHKRAKVLMVGPVDGQLRLLSEKLRTLQKSKAGPFDVCLCTGPFFHKMREAATGTKAEEEDLQKKELYSLQEIAVNDGKDLVAGSLTFDVPVLFVDEGGGLPDGLNVPSAMDSLKKDDDEIDLDEEDGGDGGAEDDKQDDAEEHSAKTPDGLLRITSNLYQLVGNVRKSKILDSVADIISVPLPLADPRLINNASTKKRVHATSLTIGFLGSSIRLPCKDYEEKCKHTSFLGCDVLISGEWGQGMSSKKCGALTPRDQDAILGFDDMHGSEMGSYDVAELVAMGRPRYHLAPGPAAPVQVGDAVKLRKRFIASLPYRYPTTSSLSGDESHAGRFLAMGSVVPPLEAKALGKAFKFIHAVGIVPLSHMGANDREAAKELNSVVECPYVDASYGVDDAKSHNMNSGFAGKLSEARARRLAQEAAASAMGGDGEGAHRWQQRPSRKRPSGDGGGRDDDEAKRQALEAENPENCSLFLHGLHRDPGMMLTVDVLMDAFRPFGCVGVRFPKPKMNRHHHHHQTTKNSYAFLDFNMHEEAAQCLADLKGKAVVCSIILTLKWSSGPSRRPWEGRMLSQIQMQQQTHITRVPLLPPHQRRNRLTEVEATGSTTLFFRLPPTLDSSAYPDELETLRLLAQGTMEDELNVGVPLDSPDRITAKDEPALRVAVRHPNAEINYGFMEFCSHAAALTTLVTLTGDENGGVINEEKLTVSCLISDDMKKIDISHLQGVTLYWARGSQPKSANGNTNPGRLGLKLSKRHFPPDSRTDCWFCLASPTCEKHLIVAVYDECYIAMPKGAVNEFHSLIVPVEHGGDGALVNRKLAPEMDSVKSKLRVHARTALKKDLFVFERCIQTKGGYHTHVQCIPVDADSGPKIQSKMLEIGLKAGFQLKEITSDLSLNALEDDWSDGYFYAEIPSSGGADLRRFIYRVGNENTTTGRGSHGGGSVPLQFGREVLAEVIGNPDIGQWKACIVSHEKEEEMTAEFRKSFFKCLSKE